MQHQSVHRWLLGQYSGFRVTMRLLSFVGSLPEVRGESVCLGKWWNRSYLLIFNEYPSFNMFNFEYRYVYGIVFLYDVVNKLSILCCFKV